MRQIFVVLYSTFLCFEGRRGFGRGKLSGSFDGVDSSLLDPTSFLPMETIRKLDYMSLQMDRATRFANITTRIKETMYGTKINSNGNVSEKPFGLGVGAGFVGSTGLGFGSPNYGAVAGLVTYSVYHRYVMYKNLMYRTRSSRNNYMEHMKEDIRDYRKHYDEYALYDRKNVLNFLDEG